MLRVRKSKNLNELINFGFKLSQDKSYYFYRCEECEIFIWITKNDLYLSRFLYIEPVESNMIIYNLDIIYKLINEGWLINEEV